MTPYEFTENVSEIGCLRAAERLPTDMANLAKVVGFVIQLTVAARE